MKRIIFKYILFFIALINLTGCEEFLQEDPRGIISPANFFNSDSEALSAVNGLYSTLYSRGLYSTDNLRMYYENGADVIGPNRFHGGSRPIGEYSINEGNVDRMVWRDLYRLVQDANLIINKLENNEQISESNQRELLGQALFIRALAYFHLTNIWGDVPYYRDNLPLNEVQVLGREDREKIRNEILQDLERALDLLPSEYDNNNLGRASKWAAATLKTKILLFQEKWIEARDAAVDIIENSPHRLLDDFADVFDPENEYNEEIIWEIDYVKDINEQRFTDYWTPRIRDEPKDPDKRPEFSDTLNSRNEGFTGYGLAVALPDLVKKFPQNDLRRPLTVLDNYLGYDLNFAYLPKLWNLDQINSPRANHGENRIVFRLADVYLMAAEAENEISGPSSAYRYINKVRERAYEPDQPLSNLTQQEFREKLYDERKWELAGEAHRRIDLIRWGILLEVVKNTEYRVFDPASNIKPHHVLLPIPVEELELNPNLLESDPTNNGYR